MNIKPVNTRMEKYQTYKELLDRYNKAKREGFYLEALMIAQGLVEDRIRSFLYHTGAIHDRNASKLEGSKSKRAISSLYFQYEGQKKSRILYDRVSVKIDIIKSILRWVCDVEDPKGDGFLLVLKMECEGCVDIEGMLDIIREVEDWLHYRNEVVHGLMNKNVLDLDAALPEKCDEGIRYARFIDVQCRALKKKDRIRKYLRWNEK